MNDLIVSLIRTYVPLGVGWALSTLATIGIVGVDSEAAIAAVTVITTGAYYALARYVERQVPGAGWLLGHTNAPSYDKD